MRLSKISFWNRINTGFLESAVATALTACGIETNPKLLFRLIVPCKVATALTACGIETTHRTTGKFTVKDLLQQHLPLAVLKRISSASVESIGVVATALTACGIETEALEKTPLAAYNWLQQHLPLAVLKH